MGAGRARQADLEEARSALLARWLLADAYMLKHQVQALPAACAAVRPKHGVCAQDVDLAADNSCMVSDVHTGIPRGSDANKLHCMLDLATQAMAMHGACMACREGLLRREQCMQTVIVPTSGGSRLSMRRLGKAFTESTSTKRVLRFRRCTGRAPTTPSSDRMEGAKTTTSGCSSQKSLASLKYFTLMPAANAE